MKTIITETYQCEGCGAIHPTKTDARECEAQPFDTTAFKVGDFVGAGDIHGWWNGDTTWAPSQLPGKRDWMDVPDDGWRKSPPGPFNPVQRVFLPIWIVLAVEPVQREHRLRLLLWCARHANRGPRTAKSDFGEGIARTYSQGHVGCMLIPKALQPTLTRTERQRLKALLKNPPWKDAGLV